MSAQSVGCSVSARWEGRLLLHLHVIRLVRDKLTSDFTYGLTKKILIAEYPLNSLRGASMSHSSLRCVFEQLFVTGIGL